MPASSRLALPAHIRGRHLVSIANACVHMFCLNPGMHHSWQSGSMALRWAAAGFIETEKNYRRIMGCQQLWMLKAALDEPLEEETFANERKCG